MIKMTAHYAVRCTKLLINICMHNGPVFKIVSGHTNIIKSLSNNVNIPAKQVALSSTKTGKEKVSVPIKNVNQKLQELLEVSANEVKEILRMHKQIKRCNADTLEHNYNMCINNGITKKTLLKYPSILTLHNVEKRLENLRKLPVNINLISPLLLADDHIVRRITDDAKSEELDVPYGSRIVYMSKLLNLPVAEVCEKVVAHSFILRIPLERLERILKVLLDYGIESNNIINDCWALRYSPKIAEERLKRAIEADVSKVKTWMIRCPNSVFERCINRQVETRKILGTHSSVEEYLSQRLDCSVANAKYLTEKNPAILKMNILKMKEILDYLYEQKYTSAHVCRVPRILIHSLETTKQRLHQLKQFDYIPPSLAVLCKSKRDFDKTLQKCEKLKKNADEQLTRSIQIDT